MSTSVAAAEVPAVQRSPAEEARAKVIDQYKRLVSEYADKEKKVKECTLILI